jgi:Phage terminase, small subunit
MKKPKLKLVESTPLNPAAPPPNLGPAGRNIWQSIIAEYQITNSGGLAILLQIATAYDRQAECAEAIAREGMTIRMKSGLKEHPLLRTELACRSFIVRAVHRLGLDIESVKTQGRPPKNIHWSDPDAD